MDMKQLNQHDSPHVVQAVATLFDGYRQFYGKDSDMALAEQFLQARLANDESVIFYVQRGEEYLGFTQLYPTFSSVSAGKRWVLNDLFVDPRYRGQDVGHALLERAKQFASADHAHGLQLSTAIDNVGAQKLYESLGYQKNTTFYHYLLAL